MFEIKLLTDYLKKLNPSFAASDFVDKAHFGVTCGLMLLFAAIIGSKQMWGEPISCFVPPEVPGSWADYIKGYCYVNSTYNIKANGDIMVWDEDYVTADEKTSVAYYQWVPYVLVLQALLFFLPHMLWRLFQSTQTGILDIDTKKYYSPYDLDIAFEHMVEKCVAARDMTVDEKDAQIKNVTDDLMKTHDFRQMKCKTTGLGSAGFIVYALTKLLNICNVLFQAYLLNWFVGRQSFTWDFEAIKNGVQLFPRVSMCLFKQNVLAGIQSHSVQCLLMANMVNEKVFILLYVWLAVLFVVSALNIVHFLVNYVFCRREVVERYLQGRQSLIRCGNFASWNLGFDGLLLLHFVENSAGFMMASTLAQAIYDSLEKETAVGKNDFGRLEVNMGEGECSQVHEVAPKQLIDIQKSPVDKDRSLLLNFSSA